MIKMIILLVVGMALTILSFYIKEMFKISWVRKLYPILFVVAFICLLIGGFGLKQLAFENGWWWLF